jgi:hypothetical protein
MKLSECWPRKKTKKNSAVIYQYGWFNACLTELPRCLVFISVNVDFFETFHAYFLRLFLAKTF